MAIIDRVKYDGPDDVFIWRWPSDQLVWGTQVIVNQAQEAVFFKDGKVLDMLGPGVHTLKTANIPLLKHIVNIPFGSETPFAAEIYYANKAVNMDLKWGTREPIQLMEPEFKILVPVRAFGQFGMKVVDAKNLTVSLVGTMKFFDSKNVLNYFRGHLMSQIKDYISEKIINDKISVLTISTQLNEISQALKEKVSGEFNRFGIGIENFFLNSISVPPEDESVKRLQKMLADRAEFQVMGDDRYRTMRTFDTMEKAAGNEGAAGGMMGAGMGMGMGIGAGAGMGQMMGQAMGQAQARQTTCPSCRGTVAAGMKFCSHCGKSLQLGGVACGQCKTISPAGAKFCPGCGTELAPGSNFCTKCGSEIPSGAKFCPGCGQAGS